MLKKKKVIKFVYQAAIYFKVFHSTILIPFVYDVLKSEEIDKKIDVDI